MTDNKKLIKDAMSGLNLIKIKTNKKGIRKTDKNIRKNLYKDVLDPLTKKAVGGSAKAQKGSTDFGMLSVKYGIDENPNETRADFIAGATKGKSKKPQGAFIGKIFQDPKIRNMMFDRIKADKAIQDPEAYRQAYNKYATAYGNEPMKGDDPKVAKAGTGKFMVKGMGAAIRGGLTKGSS